MSGSNFQVLTASGKKTFFSAAKVATSLRRSGASEEVIQEILEHIQAELYEGISTKEIFKRAFGILRKKNRISASKYKLKKALFELGPTGFPFERFVAAVYDHLGYHVEISKTVAGKCVSHEIDVIAVKEHLKIFIECKFHSLQAQNCNVRIPLYINSRYLDILDNRDENEDSFFQTESWVITNTRFTADALAYGHCVGLNLISWDTPRGSSLKELIDRSGLYPITVSTLLTQREKQFLLSRDVVLCRDLINDDVFLDQLNISEERKPKIKKEMKLLFNPQIQNYGKDR